LHAKVFPRFKVSGVCREATIEILWVNPFGPSIPCLLRHAATRKGQPWPIEPDAAFVFAGHPNHYGRGIHYFAKPLIKATWMLDGGWVGCRFDHVGTWHGRAAGLVRLGWFRMPLGSHREHPRSLVNRVFYVFGRRNIRLGKRFEVGSVHESRPRPLWR
jgi:hypothetical protein